MLRSLKKDSFKEFLSAIRGGDAEKVKILFKQDFINKRILDEPNGLRPIHVACENDNVEIVKFLIDRNCDFDQRTNESLLPIHIACQAGCISVVDYFLKKKNLLLEIETKEKYRPVHFACKYGHVDILLFLINYKCNITCTTIAGYTPLHLACEAGMTEIANILLTYNCPVDTITKNGHRPIDLARNHKDIIALLSDKNCVFDFKENRNLDVIDVDMEDLNNYGNQIFKCIRENNINIFKNIYDPLKPIMNDVQTKMTVMEFAISEKAYEFVELILADNMSNEKFEKYFIHFKEIHANIFDQILEQYTIYRAIRFNFKTELKSIKLINQNCILTGSSFFELAVKYGSLEYSNLIMMKLINKNENVWNKAKQIAQDNLNYEICKLITNREKYLETRCEAMWTRLHIAVNDDDIEMVKYLIKSNHDTFDTLPSIGSPLNLAAISGRIECFKLLLGMFTKEKNSFHVAIKNGMSRYCIDNIHTIPDLNEMDEDGNTLLHLSAKFLSTKLCGVLLEQKADPNIINCNGNTPLQEMLSFNFHRFSHMENEICSISKLLLDYKTDINIKNNYENSIFQDCLKLKNVNFILLIADNQNHIELTRNDLKIIMDNNWIDVLEIVLPQCLQANQFIDKEMLSYFLKNRTPESFNSLWFLADPDTKGKCVATLLYECALNNNKETFTVLSEESKCDFVLFNNGETLFTSLLKLQKQDFCCILINSNLSSLLVNQSNSRKETPLHIAAKNEYFNLLENMLYVADDINKEDSQGFTPFTILINSISSSEEVERISKLIISKSLSLNHDNPSMLKSIENCRNQDLKIKLGKLYKVEIERKPKNEEVKNMCNVCLDNIVNISFDCGHTSCNSCAIRMKICPICRSVIRNRNALFL